MNVIALVVAIVAALAAVGAVVAAVRLALRAERRSDRQIEVERGRSDRVLGEQRDRERAAIEDERAHSRAQLEEERRLVLEGGQFAEAYAVQVGFGERDPGQGAPNVQGNRAPSEIRELAVMVVNRGSFPVWGVEAQFVLGNAMIQPRRPVRLPGSRELSPALVADFSELTERSVRGVLAPWDTGIRFETDGIHVRDVAGWYPVVRWRDRWGAFWEHKRGQVRRIEDGAPWEL